METDFLASTNHKLFFRLVETYFFNESFIPAIGEGFFYILETVYFTWEFLPTSQNRHSYEWKTIS